MIKSKRAKLYIMSVLGALEFIIAFSAIGYITVGEATITLANIPVLAGAMLLGPIESTALGLIFGLTSLLKSMSLYCTGVEVLLSPIQSGNPAYSLILAVGSRVVFGLLAGLIYRLIARTSRDDETRIVTVFSSLAILAYYALFYFLTDLLFGENILYSESIMATLLTLAVNLMVAVLVLNLLQSWMLSERMTELITAIGENNTFKLLNKKLRYYITLIISVGVLVVSTLLIVEFYTTTSRYFEKDSLELFYYRMTTIEFHIATIMSVFVLAIAVRYYAFYTLVESERNKTLINMIPGGVCIIEDDGDGNIRIPFISDGIKDLMSVDRDTKVDAKSINPLNYIHPEDIQRLIAQRKNLSNDTTRFETTYRIMNKERGYVWVTFRAFRTQVVGKTARYYGVIIDADNKIRRQNELERRYDEGQINKDLMALDADVTFYINLSKDTCNLELNNTQANLDWAEDVEIASILLRRASERNTNMEAMVAYQKLFNVETLRENYDHGRTVIRFEHNFMYSEHNIKWTETRVIMMCNPLNNDIEGYLYIKDIDEQKNTRIITERILSSDYEYIELINIEDDSTQLYISKDSGLSAKTLENMTYTQIMDHHLCKIVLDMEPDEIRKKLSIATIIRELEEKPVYSVAFSINTPTGEQRKLLSYQYMDKYRKRIIFTQSDITDVYAEGRYKADVLRDAIKAAEDANKAKEEFVARISHDLRTPLNAIMGLSTIALTETDMMKIKEYLNEINMSGELLCELANDMVDREDGAAIHSELHLSTCSLNGAIKDLIAMSQPRMEAGNLKFEYNESLYMDTPLVMDKSKVRQIVSNILTNAIDYTPAGGSISLTIEQNQYEDNDVIYTRFTFVDTGVGMTNDVIEKAIRPFNAELEAEEIDTESHRAGVGLPVVKLLLDIMGGQIKIKSGKNQGTTVVVEIPFKEAVYDYRVEEPGGDDQDLKGKRILVVEDNLINMEMASIILEKEGMIVDTADNGLRAVEAILDNPEDQRYDAVLMDIQMPILDGIKATRSIRSLGTDYAVNLPIIAMTANAFEEDVNKSIEAGMNGHISKPVSPTELFRVLDREINKKF